MASDAQTRIRPSPECALCEDHRAVGFVSTSRPFCALCGRRLSVVRMPQPIPAGSGRPMRQAPWVETLHRNLATAGKAVQGDDLTEADAKALAELVGMVFHLPTQALWNYAAYTDALLSGELEEPVQDLLFRNPSKWE